MRARTLAAAAALAVGATGGVGALALTPAAAATPTVTLTSTGVNNSGKYYDGETATVALSGFSPGATVLVAECAAVVAQSGSSNDCDVAKATQVTTDSSGAATASLQVYSVSYSDADHNVVDYNNPGVIAAENTGNPSEQGGAQINFLHGLAVSTTSGLTNGTQVTLKVNGYENDYSTDPHNQKTIYAAECSPAVLAHIANATQYCDLGSLATGSPNADGSATFPNNNKFTVYAGRGYSDPAGDKCDGTHPCLIVVTDNIAPASEAQALQSAGLQPVTFASSVITPTATKTSLKPATKSAKKGAKVKVVATTKPTKGEGAFGGTLTVTDNGKKVGRFSEPGSGIVKFKVKLVKGKNKIVAKYSGNKFFLASTGNTTITGKA